MRRGFRWALHLISVAAVIAAFFVIPMPVASFSPGDATPLDELLAVDGEVAALNGELRLLSVYVAQPSIFGTIRGAVDDDIDLLPREDVFPSGVRRVDFQERQRENFRSSFRIAAGIGLAGAGLDVTIETVARVADVVADGPADGTLMTDDLITTLDGQDVASSTQLVDVARSIPEGEMVRIELTRGGVGLVREVTVGALPNTEQIGIGIAVETIERELVLPLEVEIVDQRSIGGPSAGLMIALTVYDLVADEDLTDGRQIAGTGTIDGGGRVGRIGGIREKTIAAIEDGATIMLVPAEQAAEARAVADGRLEVIGVTTFDEALTALRSP